MTTRQAPYILGHDGDELDRLIDQARFFGDLTDEVLGRAGIGPGMRVLDIGCGTGDVSFLAARRVGPTGMVLGIDRAPEAVELAQRRARQAGLTNVSFAVHDLSDLTLTAPVDALIGRLVLMYLGDPAAPCAACSTACSRVASSPSRRWTWAPPPASRTARCSSPPGNGSSRRSSGPGWTTGPA
jgi:2-polyprenyl-3-methyl-5-hydroxy-6-metoxy-1,4-benzoquinol methylase